MESAPSCDFVASTIFGETALRVGLPIAVYLEEFRTPWNCTLIDMSYLSGYGYGTASIETC